MQIYAPNIMSTFKMIEVIKSAPRSIFSIKRKQKLQSEVAEMKLVQRRRRI